MPYGSTFTVNQCRVNLVYHSNFPSLDVLCILTDLSDALWKYIHSQPVSGEPRVPQQLSFTGCLVYTYRLLMPMEVHSSQPVSVNLGTKQLPSPDVLYTTDLSDALWKYILSQPVSDLSDALWKYIHSQPVSGEPRLLQQLATYLTFHDFPAPDVLAAALSEGVSNSLMLQLQLGHHVPVSTLRKIAGLQQISSQQLQL
ncbi:hypothetical protein J6590_019069 [Homalodisca vitripennis]|nr:hypothetical protein J6590_019069 [Homalodisca vitripennis]